MLTCVCNSNDVDQVYHLYNPVYPAGSLGGATALRHGTAANITGPYTWGKQPDIAIPLLGEFDGPKSVRPWQPTTFSVVCYALGNRPFDCFPPFERAGIRLAACSGCCADFGTTDIFLFRYKNTHTHTHTTHTRAHTRARAHTSDSHPRARVLKRTLAYPPS